MVPVNYQSRENNLMAGLIGLARRMALCGILLCALRDGGTVLAGPCLATPCARGYVCVPNVYGYGYFHSRWRQWPGEPRPDINFPQSIGAEVIPTPKGEGTLPPSVIRPVPGKVPSEGGILPSDTGFPGDLDSPPFEFSVPGGSLPDGPAEIPPETPAEIPPETPAEPPVETPAEPPVETPAEPPAEAMRDAPVEAPRETAAFKPLLQSGRRALAEEPRGMPPLLGPSWLGHLPGRLPGSGQPAPLRAPALNPESSIPKAEAALLKPARQSVAAERVNKQNSSVSGVPGGWPSPESLPSKSLRANWTAALHPGFRGDISRAVATYPSVERSRPAMRRAAAEPREGPAIGKQPAGPLPGPQQAGSPPVALDGYCSVELGENERWRPGNLGLSVVYQGRTYLFCGPAQRQRFLAAPHRYAPAYSAYDPVLAVDGNRRIPGQTDYCVICDGRLYMFSSSSTLARFKKNPERYSVGSRK